MNIARCMEVLAFVYRCYNMSNEVLRRIQREVNFKTLHIFFYDCYEEEFCRKVNRRQGGKVTAK